MVFLLDWTPLQFLKIPTILKKFPHIFIFHSFYLGTFPSNNKKRSKEIKEEDFKKIRRKKERVFLFLKFI